MSTENFERVFNDIIECSDPKYHDFINQAKGRYLLLDKRKTNKICKFKAILNEILKQTKEIKSSSMFDECSMFDEYKQLLEKQYTEKMKMLFDSIDSI